MEEGFILEKKIGVGSVKSLANAKILVANTSMDTDKIKLGGKVTVTSPAELAAIEDAERVRDLPNIFYNPSFYIHTPPFYIIHLPFVFIIAFLLFIPAN